MSESPIKTICGIGINDADYTVYQKINGQWGKCKFYATWKRMIERCYSAKSHIEKPTYIGCSVVPEWHSFMKFRKWMETQDWEGKHLDKDIIYPGNKIYGPDTCVFVDQSINKLLIDVSATKGASFKKDVQKFRVRLKVNGKEKSLGYFKSEEEGRAAYKEAKRLHILKIACCEHDVRVKQGLYRHSELLRPS